MTEFDKYWKIRYLCTYPNNNDYIDNVMPVKDFKEYIQDAFEAGQESKENNWIKCSDRLPTEKDGNVYGTQGQFVHVLVAWKDNMCIHSMQYHVLAFNIKTNKFMLRVRNNGKPLQDVTDNIASWKPLPEIPEEYK